MYRCYCNGLEFGIDYPTLEAARTAMAQYEQSFPDRRYYARKITRDTKSRFPGWRTMTAAQRRNAKYDAIFEAARARGDWPKSR